jgi:hypothetical protein
VYLNIVSLYVMCGKIEDGEANVEIPSDILKT